MKIKIYKKIKSKKGLLVAPLFEENTENIEKLAAVYPNPIKDFIKERVKNDGYKPEKDEIISTYLNIKKMPPKLLVLGCGKKEKFNVKTALELGGRIGKYSKDAKVDELTLLLPSEFIDYAGELFLGMKMAQYNAGKFKTENKKKKEYYIERLNIVLEGRNKKLEEIMEKAKLIAEADSYVKDLINGPANIISIDYLAQEAAKIARENKYKIVILDEKDMRKLGMGGILAVNRGAEKEAKMIVLQYDGGKRKEKPIAIVGKGVVFDSGGIILKPMNSIETMQQDMAGGANILGLFSVLKKLKIQKNVIGVIPVVQNSIGERSYKPSDIITMFSGKTVEVTNTDAEGRLILADGITYAIKLDPEFIIVIATLTGATIIALGDKIAGIMGNDENILNELKKAGDSVDELVWQLPLFEDYNKKLDSQYADFRNYDTGTGKIAIIIKAAGFLEKFMEDKKWGHIDIGGTAFTDDPKPYQTLGATAHGFRLLVKFLENRKTV